MILPANYGIICCAGSHIAAYGTEHIMAYKILVADDDPHIREIVKFALEKAGMCVTLAENGKTALEHFERKKPDLAILDVMMPDTAGLDVCRAIRKISDTPILFLSSRSDEVDKVVGLELGGDDYVTKPFSPRELVARVNAILKRIKADTHPAKRPIERGGLTINADEHSAAWKGKPVTLSATEFSLLKTLVARPEKVYSRDDLMSTVYNGDTFVNDRTIDSHIRHIRAKFEEFGAYTVIETVRGVGYKAGICR